MTPPKSRYTPQALTRHLSLLPGRTSHFWNRSALRQEDTMNRRDILGFSAAMSLASTLLAGTAAAQTKTLKEQLAGTWLVATVENIRPDGSRFQSLGPNPKGILMFDANGWFSFQLAQPDARSSRPTIGCRVRRKRTGPLCKEASPTTANTRSKRRIASFIFISRAVHTQTSTASITSELSHRSQKMS